MKIKFLRELPKEKAYWKASISFSFFAEPTFLALAEHNVLSTINYPEGSPLLP